MEESQKPKKDFLLPASILIAAVLVAGSVIYSAGSKSSQTGSAGANKAADIGAAVGKKNLADDGPVLGNPKAPVTFVEFGDYQCPFCGRVFQFVEPKLREEYIKTGKVKMVFRNFPFLGPESQRAALAAECAAEQGKFWAYHDKLYETEIADGKENNGNLTTDLLKSLAAGLGLDNNRFGSCLDLQKYLSKIKKDYDGGVSAGVAGTPASFINGKLISGAVPYEVFKAAIEEALVAAR